MDTSVLLEIFTDGPLRRVCEKAIEKQKLAVSSLAIFELYRKLKSKLEEHEALSAIAWIQSHSVENVTCEIALLAADLSIEYKLATVDSIMLAHARLNSAHLLTLDNDFSGVAGVKILR